MLVILFFIFSILTIIHFVYERIILPEIRLQYRNELFVLRDRVRIILLDKSSNKEELLGAKVLHDVLNNSINRLHYLTIFNRVITIKAIKESEELRNELHKRVNFILNSGNSTLVKVFNESCIITNKMFVFNSLLMMLYFLPVFLFILLIKHIFKISTSILDVIYRKKEHADPLSFASDKQLNKIILHI